jgi:hypothetical protein
MVFGCYVVLVLVNRNRNRFRSATLLDRGKISEKCSIRRIKPETGLSKQPRRVWRCIAPGDRREPGEWGHHNPRSLKGANSMPEARTRRPLRGRDDSAPQPRVPCGHPGLRMLSSFGGIPSSSRVQRTKCVKEFRLRIRCYRNSIELLLLLEPANLFVEWDRSPLILRCSCFLR